jgi:uncharacterized phage protein (TIGR02218 family)
MRNLTLGQAAELSADLTALCRAWTITKKNGDVLRFTDHIHDLVIDGETYTATNSFAASATQLVGNSVASDTDLTVLLNDTGIPAEEVKRGLFSSAVYSLYVVPYTADPIEPILVLEGRISNTLMQDELAAVFTLTYETNRIGKAICERYTAQCRAGFGDERCKVNLAPLTFAFEVTGVTNGKAFSSTDLAAFPVDHFAQGTVLFTTGDNAGVRMEVIMSNAGAIFTLLPLPFVPTIGDEGTITRGCMHNVAACTAYGNLANYRGEPYVPGDDALRGL